MNPYTRAGWTLALMLFGAAAPAEVGAAPETVGTPVEIKVEGAAIRFVPKQIPRGKRTPRGEVDCIQDAVATLKVGKAIGFRRAGLAPGEYRLRVDAEDGRGHSLVIEPHEEREEGKELESTEGKGKKDKEPSRGTKRSAEKTAFALEKEPQETRQSQGPAVSPQPPRGGGEDGKDAPRGAPAKEPAPRPGSEASPPVSRKAADGSEPADSGKAPLLRIPLTLGPRETASESVGFDLKVSGKGSKLRIYILAGTTEARASLRFGKD